MLKKFIGLISLPLVLLCWNGAEISQAQPKKDSPAAPNGTLEKMIVANGVVTMNLQRPGAGKESDVARFNVAPDSFFTLLVFNNQLRGPVPSGMALAAQNAAELPAVLKNSANQLVIEKPASSDGVDLVVRDSKSGSVLYNIEGHQYNYDAGKHLLTVTGGRLLTKDGASAGTISITATLVPIEVDKVLNGDVKVATLPALHQPAVGTVPGPDVIVGDLIGLDQSQTGSVNGRVGLALGTDACNQGTVDADWFALPNGDHPFIPQNVYRMSGGTTNTDRFEQIGQSWGKHAFTAASSNSCGFGCNGVGGSHLGSGCSDAYGSGLNGSQSGIGSRAWVNPFTGIFNGSIANNHSGHVHDVTSHRILVNVDDLNTSLNPGATYFAEAQYIVPHEYAWCQTHPGQCNMYNNASYRRYNVTGINQPFSFASVGATVRIQPAIMAWTGATVNQIQPASGVDGIAMVGYKVTNPLAGVWHYEYAVYNQNLDRAIQSFTVPLGCGVTASNFGFHAPPQQPGFANDGTLNSQGYSNAPWLPNSTSASVTWSCETFAQNQNANAIRFGTLYNFRFDSNKPPATTTLVNATIGFFKTGSPVTVGVLAPMPDPCNPLQLTSVVSRKTHGAAGDFAVDLPLSGSAGVECRTTSGNHTFVYTFSNDVVSGNAAVTSGTGTVSGSPIFSGNTMMVNLTGVSDVQQITVTVSNVMDTFGQTLPDTAVNAVILAGDTNGNRTVNAADVAQTKAQQGSPVDQTNFRTDVNANGTINAADTAVVKADAGNSVP
jgi:hypothetical protein